MLFDSTWWLYVLITFLSIYGLMLFSWWWGRVGKASPMFIYVTLLFLAHLICFGLGAYARTMRFLDIAEYIRLMDAWQGSWLWPARLVLLAVILFLITSHMTIRVIRQNKRAGKCYGRRFSDRGEHEE